MKYFFHLHTAVMSWICTELGKKLAELPCWIWKFLCQTFSPLNNDYVVRLQASLLPSIQFHSKRETKPGGAKWWWKREIRKRNKELWVKVFSFVSSFGPAEYQSRNEGRAWEFVCLNTTTPASAPSLPNPPRTTLFEVMKSSRARCLSRIKILWSSWELCCVLNIISCVGWTKRVLKLRPDLIFYAHISHHWRLKQWKLLAWTFHFSLLPILKTPMSVPVGARGLNNDKNVTKCFPPTH